MFSKTIPGITFKDQPVTEELPIEVLPTPRKVFIHLHQHQGKEAKPIVKVGDSVKIGTKIGEMDGELSANVHSSVSGKVNGIEEHPHPILGKGRCCIIESSETAEYEKDMKETSNYTESSREELIERIKEAGVVGLGGGMFPTHIKLSPPPERKIELLIINGCESEPMTTADYRLMIEYPNSILEGARILQKITDAQRLIFAVQKNKIKAAMVLKREGAEVVILKSRYPMGAEKNLIKTITNKEVSPNMLPWDVGCIVQNVATSYACLQAVKFNKPLVERVITVAGDGIRKPKNLLVKIGTPLKDIIHYCGGYKKELKKIVMGGPMTGSAQYSFIVPIIKGTSGVFFFSNSCRYEEYSCVRCGSCVDSCPMGLLPCEIYKLIRSERLTLTENYGVWECIECGCCAYVCPSHIPLIHYFRYARLKMDTAKDTTTDGGGQ